MGAFNQIEIYSDGGDLQDFIRNVEEVLGLAIESERKLQGFIKSIKLQEDNQETYFRYERIQLRFLTKDHSDSLIWDLDIFNWPSQTYNFEIRLGTPSEALIEISSEQSVSYKTNRISQIEELMERIQKAGKNKLILFTDEANEGQFINELEGKESGMNYLFDIALISSGLNWNWNKIQYDLIGEVDGIIKFRSRHAHMNERDCN